MIYEFQIQYVKVDGNGNDKNVKESYVTESCETFGDVEGFAFDRFQELTGLDVVAIKRSKVHEIANYRNSEYDFVWEATIETRYTIDEVEKVVKYKILLYATSFDDAKSFVCNYIKQGYDMELTSLKVTKIKDVL